VEMEARKKHIFFQGKKYFFTTHSGALRMDKMKEQEKSRSNIAIHAFLKKFCDFHSCFQMIQIV